ncbi:Methyltransferase-like protein 25B [Linum perenne]
MDDADGSPAWQCKFSCGTSDETLEWIKAIINFIQPYNFLITAQVVNFFTDRLWEALDKEWIDCLRNEPVEHLLLIPSGAVQDHWPASLRQFILTSRSLAFPREQVSLQKVFPKLNITSLSSVLSQGMNKKKRHEIEVLSAVVSSIANEVSAEAIVDVGAGQGYLAQVLSFQYQHPVVAIDACSHHGKVTETRAERIRKHYVSQMRKLGSGNGTINTPRTVTCRVLSTDMLKALADIVTPPDDGKEAQLINKEKDGKASLVLAGLHACGDLSVTMLKTFSECKEAKAIVSIGCCYNLLSEACLNSADSQTGFPVSNGVRSTGITLGKSSRDLACQSAERWSCLEKDAGLQNFDLHAFRAVFQMVLFKYYPRSITESPSVGRQGKALRRQQQRGLPCSLTNSKENKHLLETSNGTGGISNAAQPLDSRMDDNSSSALESNAMSEGSSCNLANRGHASPHKNALFEKFSVSGLSRLGLEPLEEIDFHKIWNEAQPSAELIGPYWSLRAALGPVLETLLLLDRLLFIQEQEGIQDATMVPIFDPAISPRNLAIIARRS